MRTEIPIVVLGADGRPLAGASITVKTRPAGATATVYQAETGVATTANPLTSDAQGRVNGWVERGAYDALITASGLTPWTEPFDSAPATDRAVDELWMPTGLVPPIGSMLDYAGAGDPPGGQWLVADGRTLLRNTYAALYAALGGGSSPFGQGDLTTTFAIPDTKGRVTVAPDAGAGRLTTAKGHPNARGDVGGAERHLIVIGEVPAHGHGVTDPGHGHALPASTVVAVSGYSQDGTYGNYGFGVTGLGPASASAAGTGVSIQNAGGGGEHNNAQPYLVVPKIIRVL